MSKKLTSLVISIILLSLIPTETTSGSDIDLSLPLGFESISPAQSSVIYDDHFDLKGRLKDIFQAKLVKFKGEPVEIVDNGFEVKDIRLKEGINTFLIDMTDVNGRRRLVSYSISSEKKKLNLGGGSLVETAAFNTGLSAEGYSEPGPRRKALSVVTTSYTPPQYQSNASQYTASSADVVFTSPYFDQVITENKLKIGGRFNKDAGISSITVNGQSCILDKTAGTFEGPMLISPGEARRKKINSDSADYIIMKVNPENHSGKNELKVVIKPEDAKAYEDRVEYYYYQMFVMTHIFGTDIYDLEDGFQISTPYQTIQSYNKELFGEPPFGSWPYPEKGYRYDIPLNKPGRYYYNDDSVPYYFTENYPSLYYYSGLETYRGHGSIKTSITLHSPPVDNKPFVVVLKDCGFLEDLPFFPRYTISSISGYKVNGVELTQLGSDPRTSYVVLDNIKPDTDFGISVDTPYYAEGFRIYRGYIDKHFQAEFHEGLTGDILVDSNNDGLLGGDDNACEMVSPGCVFWVNDDDDYDESDMHDDDSDAVNSSGNDSSDDSINGIRDLEDFMPFNLTIPNITDWSNNQNVKFYLRAEGEGRIRVFTRVKDLRKYGAKTYLCDLDISTQQYQQEMKFVLPLDNDIEQKGKLLDSSWFDSDGNFYGIFEGAKEGTLKLILEVELISGDTSRRIVLDETYITLVNVETMFKVYNTRYTYVVGNEEGPTAQGDGLLRYKVIREQEGYGSRFSENPDRIIIWAHGYNNLVSESLKNMETLFKRLYITGYRGGFIGVVWKVEHSVFLFDTDWLSSYRTGHVFADIIRNTKKSYPDAKLDLFMHSLGANLGCYALRVLSDNNEKIVDNLILHEAAVPGEVFRGTYCEIKHYGDSLRDDFFDNIYADSLNALKGKVYNTYSANDFAISIAFPLAGAAGLSTPLDDGYVFVNKVMGTQISLDYEGLGCCPANTKFDDKIISVDGLINTKLHPYGIRDHGSQSGEYYYDVQLFFSRVCDLKKMETPDPDSDEQEE